jgi:hypothetical protein
VVTDDSLGEGDNSNIFFFIIMRVIVFKIIIRVNIMQLLRYADPQLDGWPTSSEKFSNISL